MMHSILIEIDMKRVSVEDSVYLKKYILVTVRPGGCEGTQFHGDLCDYNPWVITLPLTLIGILVLILSVIHDASKKRWG